MKERDFSTMYPISLYVHRKPYLLYKSFLTTLHIRTFEAKTPVYHEVGPCQQHRFVIKGE